jgi:hypothetical protein
MPNLTAAALRSKKSLVNISSEDPPGLELLVGPDVGPDVVLVDEGISIFLRRLK